MKQFETVVRSVLACASAAALVLGASGCSANTTFAAASDSDMAALLPTRSEIEGTLGAMGTLNEPKAATPAATPGPTFTKPPNMSDVCFEAAFGDQTVPKLAKATRTFQMIGNPAKDSSSSAGSTIRTLLWSVAEFPAAGDIQKNVDMNNDRYSKCDRYERFDAGSGALTGWAGTASDGKSGFAFASIAKGDVSESFQTQANSKDEAKDQVKRMIAVMAKRLDAAAKAK